MKTHKNAKFHTTIATLLLFSIGLLLSSNSLAAPHVFLHHIGEAYGGGIIFYVYDDGQHGLIAARADQNGGNSVRWDGGTNINTRARADGVGAGKANTVLIIANQAPVDGNPFAATVCNEYTGGGYGDWYLPSDYELSLLFLQIHGKPGFLGGLGTYYWSSTELYSDMAVSRSLATGKGVQVYKSEEILVRSIRAF